MKRVAKPEGAFNIVVEDVDVPQITPTQILIRAERSLISRGSEIWRRYIRPEAIDHKMMGYSLTGTISEVGSRVEEFSMGDRVAALAPHAQYVAVEVVNSPHESPVVILPDAVSSEAGTFWPLGTSSVLWMWDTGAGEGDTMVILGQGLVGSGCMQAARANSDARIIAVDALPLRCELASRLGAHHVIDASQVDPVAAVKNLTESAGADIVVYAVGGRAGAKAFEQAQDMTRRGALIQVIGLYEDEPLPLWSNKIQGRRLQGGYLDSSLRTKGSDKALQLLSEGGYKTEEMITHRFHFEDAPEAFDLLYNNLGETMGVLLIWQD